MRVYSAATQRSSPALWRVRATPLTRAHATSEQPDKAALRAVLAGLHEKRRELETTAYYADGARLPSVQEEGREAHAAELVQLRTRLNGRLSRATAFARHCERSLTQRDEAMARIHEKLLLCIKDVVELEGSTTGPHRASAHRLLAHFQTALEMSDAQRVRSVQVTWTGMAETVKVMGSFDNWTQGHSLEPEQAGTWTVWRSNTLSLLPGVYQIKFLIDSQSWRLAPDWPSAGEGEAANNVLIVADDDE